MKSTKCIVVSGKSNVGKTSSLKELIKIFEAKYEKILKCPYGYKRETNDVVAVFKIKNFRVGIMTEGDSVACIKRGFDLIGNCDFVIGASHIYGETINVYLERFNNNELVVLNKVASNNTVLNEKDNRDFAEKLSQLIVCIFSLEK